MAAQKVSELTALTGANLAPADELVVVDKSDTTMAASGTNKRITVAEFESALWSGPAAWQQFLSFK